VAAVVVAVVGLVAVLGVKQYYVVREQYGKDPARQDKVVTNNLRQIQAGADQYFVEHPGVSSVESVTIVGTNSTQYVKNFVTVAQETYTAIIVRGQGISAMGVAGARTVTYGP
jgi:hypothetical protein